MADHKLFGPVTQPGSTGKDTQSVDWTGSAWPNRPTGGTSIKVIWWGPDTAGYPSGFLTGDGLMRWTAV